MKILHKSSTIEERIEALKELSSLSIPLTITDMLIEETNFLIAPASTRYHGNYAGGLFDHSYAVAQYLKEYTNRLELQWSSARSPILVGLFHDLCKIDSYVFNTETNSWEWNDDQLFTEHGYKSLVAAQALMAPFTLTEEEMACIVYHMGAFTDKDKWSEYTHAVEKYPNVLYTHTADMAASRILGV